MIRLSPSAAERWVNCALSPTLEAAHPMPPSAQAREGEIAHALAEDYFKGGPRPLDRIGESTARGPVTGDHAAAAWAFVQAVTARHDGVTRLEVEAPVQIPDLHVRGRVDVLWRNTDETWIWDFKYGRTWVSAVNNLQLMAYAVGSLSSWVPTARFHLCICQPRAFDPAGPVKVWTVTGADVMTWKDRILAAGRAARAPEPAGRPGPHCLWCSGRGGCAALGSAVSALLDYCMGSEYSPGSAQRLGQELALIDDAEALLKARRSGLEAEAQARIAAGELVPGWSMQPRQSPPRWSVDAPAVADLADLFGVDVRKPLDVLTPLQAQEAGLDKSVIAMISARETWAPALRRSKNAEVYFDAV